LNRRKTNTFLSYCISNVRHIEIHTAEPLVSDLSPFEVEIPEVK
jgi:hypothetical protein